MRIAIIGSTSYRGSRMLPLKASLETQGHEVRLPTLDGQAASEFELMAANRELIDWADEVHIVWDGRSVGTWGDICMAFALRKRIVNVFLEPMSCRRFFEQYAERGPDVLAEEGSCCA